MSSLKYILKLALVVTIAVAGFLVPSPTLATHSQCSAPHQTHSPVNNECVCEFGWSGPTCSEENSLGGNILQGIGQPLGEFFGYGVNAAGSMLGSVIHEALAYVMNAILHLNAFFLALAGLVLNTAIDEAVINVAQYFNPISGGGISPVTIAWQAFRDIGNIFIIFFLLIIGITTILGIDRYGYKKLLANLILVAILINFSLFFCKAAIDITNVFSLVFYDAIKTASQSAAANQSVAGVTGSATQFYGIGGLVMDYVKMTTIYNVNPANIAAQTAAPNNSSGSFGLGAEGITTFKVILIGFIGSLLFIITSFILFAGALSLIIRLVILIFLTAISPAAMVTVVLPDTRKYFDMWLQSFTQNVMFAPIYMALLWASFSIIPRAVAGSQSQGDSLASVVSAPESAAALLFNFILVCSFMVASLVIAKKAGGATGELSIKYASNITFGTQAFMMRNTAGRLGARVAKSESLQKWAAKGGIISNFALTSAQKVSKNSFDARNTKTLQNIANSKAGKEFLPNLGTGTKMGGFAQRQAAAAKKNTEYASQFSSKEDLQKEYGKMLEEKVADPLGMVIRLQDSAVGKQYLESLGKLRQSNEDLKKALTSFEEIKGSNSPEKQAEKALRKKAFDDATTAQKKMEAELKDTKSRLSLKQVAHVEKMEDLLRRASEGGDKGVYIKAITETPLAELFTGMARSTREEVRGKIMKPESDDDKMNKKISKMLEKVLSEKLKEASA